MIRILVPQIIGFLAVATFLLSYQQKKRKQIILLNVTSRVLYILQYVLLGAYAGAVLDILGAFSSVLAGKKHTPFMRKYLRIILPAVTAVMVAAGVTIAILKVIECWNAYVWPRLITDDPAYFLVSNGIQEIRENGFGRENVPAMMAAVVAISLPLIVLFLFSRQKIMAGVARGGTKG